MNFRNMRTRLNTYLLIPAVLVFMAASFTAQAQVRPGIKFGLSTPDVHPEDIIVTDPSGNDWYKIFVENARYGVHAGVFIQMQMGGFFIQPEILYNSTSVKYRIDSLFSGGSGSHFFTDSYRSIDFPVILGLKSGPVRLGVGPVGHIVLESGTGFSAYDGFEAFFEDLLWGWQAGLGLDLWKLHIDLRYEGNFAKLGDHINFFGRRFDFATNNNRIIASLGFSF
jgi:hypothetical protein